MAKKVDIVDQIDEELDRQIRPRQISDFVGQEGIVRNIRIFTSAANMRGEALDHVLLYGPPGLGKTTLSNIIANELGSNITILSAPAIDKPSDLAGILASLNPRDVIFIDEIHRLSPVVEEFLYSAMEDYRIDIIIDKGPSSRAVQVELNPFTLVGATTRIGLLTSPLRARFGIKIHIDMYDVKTLARIVTRSAGILGCDIDYDAAEIIAKSSRGTPRIANSILKRVRDFAQVLKYKVINAEVAKDTLQALNIDEYGLDKTDRDLLFAIKDKFEGGPVGLSTLSSVIDEEKDTIEEVLEPYLIQMGFLKKTPRGRCLTELAMDYLEKTR